MPTKTFEVPNIACDDCVMTIQNELSDLEGVKEVSADQDSRMVTVQWDAPATWRQIRARLEEIGYPPEE